LILTLEKIIDSKVEESSDSLESVAVDEVALAAEPAVNESIYCDEVKIIDSSFTAPLSCPINGNAEVNTITITDLKRDEDVVSMSRSELELLVNAMVKVALGIFN